MAGAAHQIFEAGELLNAHGPAGMHLAGGDADFRAHAKFAPIGKLGGGIVHDNGGIHLIKEAGNGFRILAENGFRVARGLALDMGKSLLKARHNLHRQNGVEIFG